MKKQFEVVKFIENDFELDVRADQENETIWLSTDQIAALFSRDYKTIRKHINNALKEELDEKVVVAKFENTSPHGAILDKIQTHDVLFYNLDMVISVGYRVKSKRGVIFRRWANKILKEYLIKGYSVNEKRLLSLNKTIEIQNKMLSSTLHIDNEELTNVITEYTKALDLLDDYDHQSLKEIKGEEESYVLTYEECRKIINSMKFGNSSDVFGVEKEEGKLKGILEAVYLECFGQKVYKTNQDKASHLLYFLVKDHPFVDGCKRIAATLFLEFLNKNHMLVRNGKLSISNDALVAITLLTAESKPEEIESIIKVINNILI